MEPQNWWDRPLREVFAGRDVILVGAVPAAWNDHVRHLTAAGAERFLVVATEGAGVGAGPEVPTIVVETEAAGTMERIRQSNRTIADPPGHVRAALDEFDPDRTALVVGSFLNESADFGERLVLAHRRPEWVALEDKTRIDAFWKRADVPHQPSVVVPIGAAERAATGLDRGNGTVWAADAREGYHGGGHLTRWVRDSASRRRARDDLAPHCDTVRVMPFVEGIPCSIHTIVLPDGDAVLRPVEMITLRSPEGFVYAGCATFWDPPERIREQMREADRRAAARLRTEVGFRGTFTIDGVAAHEGFWPTELNPRYGAGINVITRAVGDIPILLLHDLAVAGHDVGIDAEGFERALVEAADAKRGGGTWIVSHPADSTPLTGVVHDAGGWRPARDDEPFDGELISGPGFARCAFDPDRTPVGPSAAPRAAALWNSLHGEIGLDIPELSPAHDPFATP